MNKTVDDYLIEGCRRCPLGGTPECKVHNWTKELELLRSIVLDTGLVEEVKWGVPCYTYQSNNVVIISALKGYCSVSFFKGALLSDHKDLLEKPGEHTQAARLINFTNIEEIIGIESDLRAYIYEAIEVEKAGLKVELGKNPEPIPEELENMFMEDLVLKTAFEALTPGRQRGYILHFSQPKQSKTRISRIKKCIPMILNGLGLNDKYKSMKN